MEDNIGVAAQLCAKCGERTFGARVIRAQGRHFHERCFCCDHCGSAFPDSAFYPVEGSLLCAACRDSHLGPFCEKCEGSLAVCEQVVAQDKLWHPECFCCDACNEQIDVEYCEHAGCPLCDRCYDQRYSARCAGCQAVVEGGVVAQGSSWHAACFVCETCGVQLVDEGAGQPPQLSGRGPDYFLLDGFALCKEHYLERRTPSCGSCLQPVAEPIAALGAVYHRGCLVCAHCKTALAGSTFVEHEGVPYCQADYHALFGGRADRRAPPERSHAFLLRLRSDGLRDFASGHSALWREARRELREEGARNAQAHVFADGTVLLTLSLEEARDAEMDLAAIFEREGACGKWIALLRRHAPPALVERAWLFEAAVEPLELAQESP